MKTPKLSEKRKRGLFLASGSTHPALASATAQVMGIGLGDVELRRFPNSELYVRYGKTVRGKHVFVMQSGANIPGHSINDSLQETLLLVDAARRASARHVTVVAPHFPYARQDRKSKGRETISTSVVIRQLAAVGTDRIVSMDLHTPQTQGIFNGPFDHLTAEPLIVKALKKKVRGRGNSNDFVVVSPDGGRAAVAEHYAGKLGLDLVYMPKSHDAQDSSIINRPSKIDGVGGRICLMVDDMIDTAGTLVSAANTLQNSGAEGFIAAATHGLFSEPALERLQAAPIDELIVTDTVPQDIAQEALGARLQVISVAPKLGQALMEIATNGSVSRLFNDLNNR